MKKKNESKTTLIVDEPQWVIRTDKDSEEKFYVAVGDKFKASEILPKDAPESVLKEYRAKGYSLLQVPIGYYETFNDNVELALTDIAGISTTSALKFISGAKLNEIKVESYRNPFNRDVIEVGTGDDLQYSDFFNMDLVNEKDLSKPLYIHLDMSKTGDKTGIAGVWIDSKRASNDGADAKEAYYKVAFSISIKAPKGYEISFEKNRNFIRWLKSKSFKIKGVSSDTFQSAQIQQQLKSDKFNVSILSVDRLDNVDGTK
nr:MAG TPA: terminase [Caudoviricetes sp.]